MKYIIKRRINSESIWIFIHSLTQKYFYITYFYGNDNSQIWSQKLGVLKEKNK